MTARMRPMGTIAGRGGMSHRGGARHARRSRVRRKGERASPAVIAGMLVFLVVLAGMAAAAVYLDRTNPIDRTQPPSWTGNNGRLPVPAAAPLFMSAPIVSDVDNTLFSLSWVADQPINSSVEYCASGVGGCSSGALAGTSTKYDVLEYNMSHAALVRITGLAQATTYNYRAVARNASGGSSYFPASAPYPALTTKNHGADPAPGAVRTFWVTPYIDVDSSNTFVQPPDIKALKFMAYLNHSSHGGHAVGTVPLAVRGTCSPDGVGDCWVIPISTFTPRYDDATGNVHSFASGQILTFFVAGVHFDGSSRHYYWNATASFVHDGGSGVTLIEVPVHQGAPAIEELSLAPVAAVAVALLVVFASGARRRPIREFIPVRQRANSPHATSPGVTASCSD